MSNIRCFSVSVKDIPEEELETALKVLLRSFNVAAVAVRKHGGS